MFTAEHRERKDHSSSRKDRPLKDPEDLRKRLERERRLRKHRDHSDYRERKESSDYRNDSRSERRSKDKRRKDIQSEDVEEVEIEKDTVTYGSEKGVKDVADYLVVSSPDSVKHLLKEDSDLEDQANDTSENDHTSDEGT